MAREATVTSDAVTTTAKRQRQREGRVARLEAERRAAVRAGRRRRALTAVAVVAAVGIVAVLISFLGADDDGGGEAATTTTEAGPTTTAPPKPEVTVPDTPPPTTLQTTDLTVGDGAEAKLGDTVNVRYVGKIYATGEEFDSNYDAPEPAAVQLVSPGVIEGWAQGVPGMRVGGRRQLVVPPDLGYGEQGQPPDIPGNSTLVFVIDLVSVEEAAPTGG
jgi:peptidylprolyl isomerase